MYKKERKTESSYIMWHKYAKRMIEWFCPSSNSKSPDWTNSTAQEVEFLIDNGSQTHEEESDTVEG